MECTLKKNLQLVAELKDYQLQGLYSDFLETCIALLSCFKTEKQFEYCIETNNCFRDAVGKIPLILKIIKGSSDTNKKSESLTMEQRERLAKAKLKILTLKLLTLDL